VQSIQCLGQTQFDEILNLSLLINHTFNKKYVTFERGPATAKIIKEGANFSVRKTNPSKRYRHAEHFMAESHPFIDWQLIELLNVPR
jgi:hypothetical protein